MNQCKKVLENYRRLPFYMYFNTKDDDRFLNYLVNKKECVVDENGQILTENLNTRKLIEKHFFKNDYWKTQDNYSLSEFFPERYPKIKSFIDKYLLESVDNDSEIFDCPCGIGEWSEYVANHVGKVDGFEYSNGMVEQARRNSHNKGITNTTFTQFDATKDRIGHVYDAGLCFGLLTYMDDLIISAIVDKWAYSVKSGGVPAC